jgi:tetratricopeptide (TPR) repeat protein
MPSPCLQICAVLAIAICLSACGRSADEAAPVADLQNTAPAFVGARACAGCHEKEFVAWQGSHHELAMQEANADTVLGDFDNAEFEHFRVRSSFFRRDGGFWVRTDNADGELQEFEVKYTFGVTPLQQYLVEFPRGRLQTLAIAWDSRPGEEGGQRWFHVYGDEIISHTDRLHWTGREQNWNYMCAECHSTGLRKNYNLDTDTFRTDWTEIDVACEACHGPGSNHALDPEIGLAVDLDDAGGAAWEMDSATGIAQRTEPRTGPHRQAEACGRCHSRRGVIAADYEFGRPLTDTHLPSLLEEHLYFADGQIRDEVYVYGSFLQSKMYRAGVACSDCHDPHTAGLKTTGKVSRVCASCHLSTRFDTGQHHHHDQDSVECVDCHMPPRTYMVVDPRRDHSFRVPRPALTVKTGSPNACSQCHKDKGDQWAADAVASWHGAATDEPAHFAEAIHAGRLRTPGANAALVEVIGEYRHPAIARATALTLLAAPLADDAAAAIRDQLSNADPLIRTGALRALSTIPAEYRAQWAATLLGDPVRAVRIQAVAALSPARGTLRQSDLGRFQAAEREYIAAQLAIAERPEAHVNLGNLYAERGDATKAEQSYLRALQLEPRAIAARVNLADLYRRLSRNGDAEQLLRDGLGLDDASAALHHALGLTLVRAQKPEAALAALGRAAELDASDSRYVYVFAVALNSLGKSAKAIETLERARDVFPGDYDIGWALATMYRDVGRADDARAAAENLLERFPEDQNSRALLESL